MSSPEAIHEIEENLLKKLENANCPRIKQILTIILNCNLKTFLTDQSYSNEKLNLFAWLVIRYESQLATNFLDFDLLPLEVKAKNVYDGLIMIGLVDSLEFPIEKLFNVTPHKLVITKLEYKQILLLITELIQLSSMKTNNFQNINETIEQMFDQTITEFDVSTMAKPTLSRMDEFFLNSNFFKEFHVFLQSINKTRLPADITSSIKEILGYNSAVAVEAQVSLLKKSFQQLEEALHAKTSSLNASRLMDQTVVNVTLPIVEQTSVDLNVDSLMRQLYEFKCTLLEFNEITRAFQSAPNRQASISSAQIGPYVEEFVKLNKNYEKFETVYTSLSNCINEQYKIQNSFGNLNDQSSGIKKLLTNHSLFEDEIDKRTNDYMNLIK